MSEELVELDLAVAKAEGIFMFPTVDGKHGRKHGDSQLYQPTRDPAEAMRLLEKYGLSLKYDVVSWEASGALGLRNVIVDGPTPAIAICRAVVALAATTKTSASHEA